ncbi:MAG: hypothetical protein ABID61_03755, partial [Candidatus Micrarchaeota archaeon]
MKQPTTGHSVQRKLNLDDSRKVARLWKIARLAMDSFQHSDEQTKVQKTVGVLDFTSCPSDGIVLDASCGVGHLLNVRNIDTRKWYYSDGDQAMVDCILESLSPGYPALDIRRSFWHEIPEHFHKILFDRIIILGNSLPYVCNWTDDKPEAQILTESIIALRNSLTAIFTALKPHGKFLFDLTEDLKYRFGLSPVIFEGRILHPFIHAEHTNGIRYWHFGTEQDEHLIKGLALDIEMLRSLLLEVGFQKIELVPEKF